MKKLTLAFLLFFVSAASAFANSKSSCNKSLLTKTAPALAQWRSAVTHPHVSEGFAQTNKAREAQLKSYERAINQDVIDSATDSMYFEPAAGVRYTVRYSRGYQTGSITTYSVSGIGAKNAFVAGTLVLPVSGHAGYEEAKKWAKSDRYKINVDSARGTIRRKTLVNNKSLAFATMQEILIPVVKAEEVTIYYERTGSGGSGAFPEARTIKFKWDGT